MGRSNRHVHCGHKNVPLYFCQYLRQLLTNFSKFFHWHTLQTICLIITNYYISHHTINAFLHYLVKYKCKQKLTIITKILVNEKCFRPTVRWMIRMTIDCVIPTQCGVIQIIHCNVGLKCFFNFTKMFVIIVMYAYFIDISQDSAETHLQSGGICNNHVIANCLQSVPVKKFWKSINNWQRYG